MILFFFNDLDSLYFLFIRLLLYFYWLYYHLAFSLLLALLVYSFVGFLFLVTFNMLLVGSLALFTWSLLFSFCCVLPSSLVIPLRCLVIRYFLDFASFNWLSWLMSFCIVLRLAPPLGFACLFHLATYSGALCFIGFWYFIAPTHLQVPAASSTCLLPYCEFAVRLQKIVPTPLAMSWYKSVGYVDWLWLILVRLRLYVYGHAISLLSSWSILLFYFYSLFCSIRAAYGPIRYSLLVVYSLFLVIGLLTFYCRCLSHFRSICPFLFNCCFTGFPYFHRVLRLLRSCQIRFAVAVIRVGSLTVGYIFRPSVCRPVADYWLRIWLDCDSCIVALTWFVLFFWLLVFWLWFHSSWLLGSVTYSSWISWLIFLFLWLFGPLGFISLLALFLVVLGSCSSWYSLVRLRALVLFVAVLVVVCLVLRFRVLRCWYSWLIRLLLFLFDLLAHWVSGFTLAFLLLVLFSDYWYSLVTYRVAFAVIAWRIFHCLLTSFSRCQFRQSCPNSIYWLACLSTCYLFLVLILCSISLLGYLYSFSDFLCLIFRSFFSSFLWSYSSSIPAFLICFGPLLIVILASVIFYH